MYIKSREDAMGALAEILELPERRSQIVQSTVKVALCLTAEARIFMLDVQASILAGGLDELKRRRQEAIAQMSDTKVRRRAPGVDVRKDPLLEEIGAALDLLKMVDILSEVFPDVGAKHPKWEIARFIHENQSYAREAMEAGLRRRGKPEHAPLQAKLLQRMADRKPWWPEWADSIRQACRHYVTTLSKADDVHPAANDPEILFYVLAMSDERARGVLNRMAGTSAELQDYLSQFRTRIDLVMTAQQEQTP